MSSDHAVPVTPRASRSALILCGMLSLAGYVAILGLSPSFAYDVPQRQRPLLVVLGLFAALFGIYLVAVRLAIREERFWARGILGFALFFRAILLVSEPIQEVDIYRYLWDGIVVNERVSPFAFAPQTVLEAPTAEELPADLQKLVQIRDSSRGIQDTLHRVHYGFLPTVYPPVSQTVFAATSWCTPRDANVRTRVLVMKFVLLLFDLGTMGVILATLRHANLAPGWVVAYGWCPLVIKEFANSGHLDSIAVFLTASAVYCTLRGLTWPASPVTPQSDRRPVVAGETNWLWPLAGAALLGLAVGAKLYPIAFVPLLAGTAVVRWGWRASLVIAIVFVLVTVICLAPFLGPESPTPANPFEQMVATHDRQAGLKAFLSTWMMNDLIFLSLAENATPDSLRQEDVTPWFVVVPNSMREGFAQRGLDVWNGILGRWSDQQLSPDRFAFTFARLITAVLFLLVALHLAWQAARAASADDWLANVFLTMAWFWLLLPTLNPWYWTWALPWVAFARNRVWLGMSGVLFIYYLRFFFEARPDLAWGQYQGVAIFDYIVVWFEYIPLFIGLVVWRLWNAGTARRPAGKNV